MNIRAKLRYLDKRLLVVSLIFIIFGLIMVFSASSISSVLQYGQTEYYFFRKQLIIIIGSLILSGICLFIPIKKYRFISGVGMLAIVVILFLLKTYGSITNSARSWFSLPGGFSIQPSEFAKTIIILFLATFYGSKLATKKIKNVQDLFIPLIPCVVIFILVASEPDLGTALIIAGITALIFFSLPIGKNKTIKLIKIISIIIVLLGFIFINQLSNMDLSSFLTDAQASRFNYHAPCSRYLEETGYQVCNGYIAINNGGITGVGLGNSTQKYLYLPEAHTDFIFPIIVEELGLIGGFLVLIGYIILLYSLLYIAANANNLTGSIIAFGTFSYILMHLIINIGGLLALIPLTGVPLPFLSYGGSYMINLIVLMGICQRVSIESRVAKYKKEIKAFVGD